MGGKKKRQKGKKAKHTSAPQPVGRTVPARVPPGAASAPVCPGGKCALNGARGAAGCGNAGGQGQANALKVHSQGGNRKGNREGNRGNGNRDRGNNKGSSSAGSASAGQLGVYASRT